MAKGTGSAQKQPNILIIWGDDIGWFNVSAYNHGIMGYRTPNIDRIAKEGAMFTDWYGQQSCTAGRAAFITGQSPIRTGLTKVGLPGADLGLQPEDPTIADVLKPLGYVCGQFGKNHLGDRDEFLPTAHGFDEFFGNLYHLNAEQEPECPDYPKDAEFKKKYGPRGVLHSWANPDGTQKIENTGPLNLKRMAYEIGHTHSTETRDVVVIDRRNRIVCSTGALTAPALTSFAGHSLYFAEHLANGPAFFHDQVLVGQAHPERQLAATSRVSGYGWKVYLQEPVWRSQRQIAAFYFTLMLGSAIAVAAS